MIYINTVANGYPETIDTFQSYMEAFRMLKEYKSTDPDNRYWISHWPVFMRGV